MKKLFFAAVLLAFAMASCRPHTCPTYMKNDPGNQDIRVKMQTTIENKA